MIKSEISSSIVKEILFPKLMRHKTGSVVLFNSFGSGMVVYRKDDGFSYKVGFYSDSWDMTSFTECNESINLTNI